MDINHNEIKNFETKRKKFYGAANINFHLIILFKLICGREYIQKNVEKLMKFSMYHDFLKFWHTKEKNVVNLFRSNILMDILTVKINFDSFIYIVFLLETILKD